MVESAPQPMPLPFFSCLLVRFDAFGVVADLPQPEGVVESARQHVLAIGGEGGERSDEQRSIVKKISQNKAKGRGGKGRANHFALLHDKSLSRLLQM